MRRLSNSLTLCTGMLMLAAAPAWAQKEELWLDSQSGTPIQSEMVLKRGWPYLVTMQGTYSSWGGMSNPGARSGKTEPAPMFPSPKGANLRILDKPYGDNYGRVRIFVLPGA